MVTVHLLEKCNIIQLSMSDDCFLLIVKYHNLETIWNNHIFLKGVVVRPVLSKPQVSQLRVLWAGPLFSYKTV